MRPLTHLHLTPTGIRMQRNASRRRVSWGGYPASGRPAVKDPAVPGGERHAPTDYQDPRFLSSREKCFVEPPGLAVKLPTGDELVGDASRTLTLLAKEAFWALHSASPRDSRMTSTNQREVFW